ncbi:hypothetical protein GCM10023083_60550 [Streptomyces phyllanthi]
MPEGRRQVIRARRRHGVVINDGAGEGTASPRVVPRAAAVLVAAEQSGRPKDDSPLIESCVAIAPDLADRCADTVDDDAWVAQRFGAASPALRTNRGTEHG